MYILPSIHSSHGHWKLGVAARKCMEAGFLVASRDSGTFVSSLRESLSACGGLVHSYPTSKMPNRPKWQIINFHWETELTGRSFKAPVSRSACSLFNMEVYLRRQIKIRMLPSGELSKEARHSCQDCSIGLTYTGGTQTRGTGDSPLSSIGRHSNKFPQFSAAFPVFLASH